MCAYSSHLVLEDNYVLASEACDKVYFYAHIVQSLSLRISDSAANAAANYCYSLDVAVLGSNAERAYYVKYRIALIEHSEFFSRSAYCLEDYSYASLFSVVICNGKRDPFAVLIYSINDKLTGKSFFSNERRVDLHKCYRVVQLLFL